ncbi:MAG TPA: dihydropyrimidinase [Rubrobacteraceae bacterium]|nr:dihydropyrimidinase [Rubrobacteraceae bacterium]
MAKLLFTDGKVVTAEGSYRADVLVEDEKVVAVGTNLDANGAETVDAAGKLVMPGFIDAHTHMDMPFGGTVTADDWATGTEAAVAGGTTMLIDFSLQEEGGTLAGAVDAWTEKARGKAVIDHGFHVAITDLRDDIKAELPDLAARGVASVKIFMAYKGTPLYTEDDDLFETLQLSKEAGVLVMVHAENGDVIAKLQQQALERGDVAPKFHALTRPEEVEAEATNRAIRLAEVAGAPILVVHVSCAPALEAIHLAHERGQTVYAETCPQYFAFEYEDLAREGFEGAKYVCSPPLRDPSNRPALWNGLRVGDLQIFGSDHCSFNYEGQKEMGKDDFTLIPNGLPGAEERAMALWTLGVREGKLSENQFVAVLSTNQARIYGAYPRKGTLAPGADADVVLWDPELSTTATAENRHGNVDYTPYEGMSFTGGPASVYVRGSLVYRDGEVVGERGSGKFIERRFTATSGLEVRV